MGRQTLFLALTLATVVTAYSNDRPIVGILSQETDNNKVKYGDVYIPASYVKFLESGGARVVPIWVKSSMSYYEKIFSKINGMLLPGGHLSLVNSEMAKAARILYKMALKANDEGDYFPIWGTCCGFQLLTVLTATENVLTRTDSTNMSVPLELTPVHIQSRLLGNLAKETYETLTKESIAINMHIWGLTLANFSNNIALSQFYRPLSTNKDRNGKEFISTMEAYHYPIYGTQWHPEKNNFVWDSQYAINHGHGGVLTSQYFANFFVAETRKSRHKFPDIQSEIHAIIQNYPLVNMDNGNQYYFVKYTDIDSA